MKEEIRENVEQVKDFVAEEMDSIPDSEKIKQMAIYAGAAVSGAVTVMMIEKVVKNRNKIKQKLADTKEARKIKKMEKKEKKATFTRTVDEDGRTEYEVSEE